MKRSLEYLKRLAGQATSFRGHRMKWGNPYGRADGPKSCIGRCRKCGMEAQVTEAPAPNQIDIGGEAVALNCNETNRLAS